MFRVSKYPLLIDNIVLYETSAREGASAWVSWHSTTKSFYLIGATKKNKNHLLYVSEGFALYKINTSFESFLHATEDKNYV